MEPFNGTLKPRELIIRPKPVSIAEFDRLESRQIIACPDAPIAAIKAGKAISIPSGAFDVELILDQLKFQPDLVSLSARVMTFLPQGLKKFNCPTVMKIGDTFHFGDGSLSRMIEYCRSLDCDYHWTYQSVQHLHFFVAAGLKNVFWLPGTIVIDECIPPKPEQKSDDVIFRGGESELHFYRKYILKQLQAAGVSIDIQSKPYAECLEDYAKARIVVNCSLNGDLNRRVFEVLMSGGFLLTDRIRPQTGLFQLLQEGIHFECYGSELELIEKIEFYLAHPEKAEQIAAAGHCQFLEYYRQREIQQKLYRYIFTNEIETTFQLQHDRRSQRTQSPTSLKTRTKIYQAIQELHRLSPQLSLIYWRGRHRTMLSDLADLPRLHLTYANDSDEIEPFKTWCADLEISDQVTFLSIDTAMNQAKTPFQIVLVDADSQIQQQIQEIASRISDSGFLFIVGSVNLFTIVSLNRWLQSQSLMPVMLCVDLFGQSYPIELEGQGLLFQKLEQNGLIHVNSSLKVHRLSVKTMIKDQLKALPIFDFVRRLRSDRAKPFVQRWFSSLNASP